MIESDRSWALPVAPQLIPAARHPFRRPPCHGRSVLRRCNSHLMILIQTRQTPMPNPRPYYQPSAHREQPRLLGLPGPLSKSAREWHNVDCAAADGCGPISPPPSTLSRDECIGEMQFRSHDPNPHTIDPNGQPAPLPTTPDQRPRLLDSRDYVTGAADSGLPPQSPRGSQPPPIWPLGLCCRRRKIKAHLSNS